MADSSDLKDEHTNGDDTMNVSPARYPVPSPLKPGGVAHTREENGGAQADMYTLQDYQDTPDYTVRCQNRIYGHVGTNAH